MKKINKKALIVDSSGVHPLLFTIHEKDGLFYELERFLDGLGIECFFSDQAQHEFSTLSYTSGVSLFNEPVAGAETQRYDAVYLSDAAYFSTTAGIGSSVLLSAVGSSVEVNHPTLWETSKQWEKLSNEDRSIINTAKEISSIYSSVAILTNDWNLRQQSTLYEGVETRGTCSMLAGLVLNGYISYQSGTYIFKRWLLNEPRWVPTNHPKHRKFTFKEILEMERNLRTKSKSFWVPQS